MKKHMRQFLLIGVVLVIGLAIFLNWRLGKTENADEAMTRQQSQSEESSKSPDSILGQAQFVSANKEYFDAARLNRQETRQAAIDIANGVLASETATQEERDAAAGQILSLSQAADAEGRIENLIMAKGYAQCVAFIGEDSVNVVVGGAVLTSQDAVAIKDIVVSQTEMESSAVKIIESK